MKYSHFMLWTVVARLVTAQDYDTTLNHNPKRKCNGIDVISSQREFPTLGYLATFVNAVDVGIRFAHVGRIDEGDNCRNGFDNISFQIEHVKDSFRNVNVMWDPSHNVYADVALNVFSPQRHFSNVRECGLIRSWSVWNVGSEWNLSCFYPLPGLPHPCGITIY